MASLDALYALGTEGSTWSVQQDFAAVFDWKYDDSRDAMLRLYAKGKEMQWEAARAMYECGFMERYRTTLFTRIVPIVKDIGLWGSRIRRGYADMGIMADVQVLQDEDEHIAREFDARRRDVQRVIDRARRGA